MDQQPLKFVIWDVGHGLCIWIQTPKGHHHWIDCGAETENDFSPAEHVNSKHGVKTIDYLIITHPDADHLRELWPGSRGQARQGLPHVDGERLLPKAISDDQTLVRKKVCWRVHDDRARFSNVNFRRWRPNGPRRGFDYPRRPTEAGRGPLGNQKKWRKRLVRQQPGKSAE